jgi:hypothetical protein
MAEYYFDIETYSTTPKPNPLQDKVITIQYQRLGSATGRIEEDLQILTEKEYGSEEKLLEKFKEIFITDNNFDFIPIGVNLYGYDFIVLMNKFKQYFGQDLTIEFLRNRPVIDLKPTLVMMNGGKFVGYNQLLDKKQSGNVIREFYEKGDWNSILNYIKDEAKNFVEKYQIIKRELMNIKLS